MINIKDGGTSSYKKLYDISYKEGDTYLSKDGSILVIILQSARVAFIRTEHGLCPRTLNLSTVGEVSLHHTFKAVDVDFVIHSL
jgi:hypothetical protein